MLGRGGGGIAHLGEGSTVKPLHICIITTSNLFPSETSTLVVYFPVISKCNLVLPTKYLLAILVLCYAMADSAFVKGWGALM